MNKNLFKTLMAIVCSVFMFACNEADYGDADQSKLPSISDYKDAFKITVDQDSNKVTYQFTGKGVQPVWIIDGKTRNDLLKTEVVSSAGTYSVEVKVSNKYGVSDGSYTLKYTVNTTLVDKAKITSLCGGLAASTKQWVWNSKANGHFGCGPDASNPTGWWSCAANGKAGVGMYDDVFTFSIDKLGNTGGYTYDPGTGKTVYVNSGCTFSPFNAFNTHDGNDYQATVAVQNSTWKMEMSGSDLYITFPAGTLVGYVPNVDIYNNPRFKVVSISNDILSLVCFNGSIAWKVELISKAAYDSGAAAELDGSQYASAIPGSWKWDETTDGHFGCGPDPANSTGWWSCGAEGKAGFGLYDDVLKFEANGKYTYDPGTGGKVYCNWGTFTILDPTKQYYSGDGSTDYQLPVSVQTSTYTITKENSKYYLVFPAKTFVSYVPSEEVYNNPKYLITKMTSNLIEFVSLGTGISWHYRMVRVN